MPKNACPKFLYFSPPPRESLPSQKAKILTGRELIVFETSVLTQLPQSLGGKQGCQGTVAGAAEGTDFWAEPEPRALGLGVFFSFGQVNL